MLQWFYITGLLLIVIGLIRLLAGYTDKSEKKRKSQELSNQAETLSNIANNLNQNWKS